MILLVNSGIFSKLLLLLCYIMFVVFGLIHFYLSFIWRGPLHLSTFLELLSVIKCFQIIMLEQPFSNVQLQCAFSTQLLLVCRAMIGIPSALTLTTLSFLACLVIHVARLILVSKVRSQGPHLLHLLQHYWVL